MTVGNCRSLGPPSCRILNRPPSTSRNRAFRRFSSSGYQSRALIDAVGLEWEDACLSFYESKRMVKTLSSAQVRQPMYSSSVAAWKRFEKEMQPFIEEYEKFTVEVEA